MLSLACGWLQRDEALNVTTGLHLPSRDDGSQYSPREPSNKSSSQPLGETVCWLNPRAEALSWV